MRGLGRTLVLEGLGVAQEPVQLIGRDGIAVHESVIRPREREDRLQLHEVMYLGHCAPNPESQSEASTR